MKQLVLIISALFFFNIAFPQVGIGTKFPHSSSILDLTATDKALLLPRVANTTAISNPVNGMMIYAVNPKCFKGYQDGAWYDISPCSPDISAMTFGAVTYQGISVINSTGIGYNGESVPSASTITVQVTVTQPTPYSFSATHPVTGLVYSASGSFASAGIYPVVLQNNGVAIPWDTYGVLTMTLTGANNSVTLSPRIDIKSIPTSATTVADVTFGTQTWMDRNLGARRVATAINDVLSYGNHYQWGRPADGHEISIWNGTTLNSGRGFYSSTTVLATSDIPGHPNHILTSGSPNDWRDDNNNNRWVATNQGPCPAGYHVPTIAQWTTADTYGAWNNNTDTYNSELKLPSAGRRLSSNGNLDSQGTYGYYWSSDVVLTNARSLTSLSTTANTNTGYARAFGFTVRCLKD